MQEEITRRVLDAIADATVSVAVDGNRAMINVVSPVFRRFEPGEKTAVSVCVH